MVIGGEANFKKNRNRWSLMGLACTGLALLPPLGGEGGWVKHSEKAPPIGGRGGDKQSEKKRLPLWG